MSKNLIHQEEIFAATPHQVYEALIDSEKHSEFTNSKAEIENKVGGTFSVWDGYATGENEELEEDSLIVQKWRASDWPEGVYSTVTYKLFSSGEGTKLLFTQEGVPAEFIKDITDGWKEYYWKPLHEYFK